MLSGTVCVHPIHFNEKTLLLLNELGNVVRVNIYPTSMEWLVNCS